MSSPSIAIVGSGPSGCYLAQALRKHWPASQVCLLDRLPVPYGLVRYGVAPDHPGTKAVTRQFDRLFEREGVHFIGNLEVGQHLPLATLRAAFDIVVLATGLYADRQLGIPGEHLPGVYGAGRLTRRFNDHPDEVGFQPELGQRCLIIGNGNVAIDVLRLLSKTAEEFGGSEVSARTLAHFQRQPLARIDIVGRSAPDQAKFDPVMLRELAQLQQVRFEIQAKDLHCDSDDRLAQAKIEALRLLAEHTPSQPPRRTIAFHFGWSPEQIDGERRVQGMRFRASASRDETLQLAADSIITAIGFAEHDGQALSQQHLAGQHANPAHGRLEPGLYCAGWFKRGPHGTIPDNRLDSRQVADTIISDAEQLPMGKPGLDALPRELLQHCTDYAGWKRLDAEETTKAPANRLRQKISDLALMLEIARPTMTGEQQP